jgi:D-alanyl-D-alanine dipeptidase
MKPIVAPYSSSLMNTLIPLLIGLCMAAGFKDPVQWSASPRADSSFRKYGLKTISTIKAYDSLRSLDPDQELVNLSRFIPDIRLDIRYATRNNIMKRPVYRTSAAFMRLPAARALKAIQEELHLKGLGLKIYDGYRPYAVTVKFYEKFHDSVFVASPYTGSRHNRGCAVDLTLVDLTSGRELRMPTSYDSFTKEAHTNFAVSDPVVLKNRKLLKSLMTIHGFLLYPDEWWHFDFDGWKKYPVTDISFEMLGR